MSQQTQHNALEATQHQHNEHGTPPSLDLHAHHAEEGMHHADEYASPHTPPHQEAMAHHNTQHSTQDHHYDHSVHPDYHYDHHHGGHEGIAALAEGVDGSAEGWATDAAAAVVSLLFLISATLDYKKSVNHHWFFLYGGTFIAHAFGGLAHRYFPNRALDGVGMRGFYFTMFVGYAGGCLRYGLGWNLHNIIPYGMAFAYLALGNVIYMFITGIIVVCKMEATNKLIDDAKEDPTNSFKPDVFFGLGELMVAIMEVVASVLFVIFTRDAYQNPLALTTAACNLVGYGCVYGGGLLYKLTRCTYNPSTTQLVFHLAIIIKMWAADVYARQLERE